MAEKDFQTELNRGLNSAGWWHHKISDVPTSRFSGVAGSRFTPPKPFDAVWMENGRGHALELKQVTAGLSFGLSNLRDHQESELLAFERAGGFGWLVVNFRVRLSLAQQRKRGINILDRAFAARIHQVVAARVDEARTGLPLDWWEERGVELPRLKDAAGITWDPTPMVAAP